MTILYFGMYHHVDSHNEVMLSSLRAAGVEVIECHYDLWRDQTVRTPARGWLPLPRIIRRLVQGIISLSWQFFRAPDHDAVMIGVIGHADFILAWILTRIRRKPLVFNAFISLYQTMVEDRELLRRYSVRARLLKSVDRFCARHADVVFLDTDQHIRYFREHLGLTDVAFHRVWIGAPALFQDDSLCYDSGDRDLSTVVFYGQYIPLHGAPTIVEAAARLKDIPVRFIMIGDGQDAPRCRKMAEELGVVNIVWIPWLELPALREMLAMAGIVLGVFGDTRKAKMVIPNKVFAAMAMGKPLITLASRALEELMTPGEQCCVVPPGDPDALAAAVRDLCTHPARARDMGRRGRARFRETCGFATIGAMVRDIVSAHLHSHT